MPHRSEQSARHDEGRATAQPRHVLVVDDSRAQRRLLAASLLRWGYRVTEAGSGDEALALCRATRFDIVLSDWMMPGLSGLEFCRAFRDLPRDGYGYFILLTSKSEKDEVALGLDGGADDFLAKPVNPDELRARIRAGERILGMERELTEKNRLIRATLDEIQQLYDSLDRDLIEARKLQQTLVRERHRDFGAGDVSLLLRPSGHVGGDLVGFFPIGDDRVALFSIDVSGHGVASAIMTARLAGFLSGSSPEQNIALVRDGAGRTRGLPPDQVAARLNRMLIDEMQVEQYFTLAYAELALTTGEVVLVQAGHPHPVVQRADGRIDRLGDGGLPIGLFSEAVFEPVRTRLHPGDRLFLMSDGITECPDPQGEELGDAGVARLLAQNRRLRGKALTEALVWDLHGFAGGADFRDDVSAVIFDYTG